MADTLYDTLIIGAGPAGLSAALYLGRAERPVALFDTGHGRSTWHQENHNYLGFPGGIPAVKLRELGRLQVSGYPKVECFEHKIISLEKQTDIFIARSQDREFRGRTVILCTGVIDHYPHFPGWNDYVGRSMFWCLICDGYEARGKQVVVMGNSNSAVLEVLQLSVYTPHITLLTHSRECKIDESHRERLGKAGFPLVVDRIDRAIGHEGQLEGLVTKGGQELKLEAFFCVENHTPETQLARQLGAAVDAEGYVVTDYEQYTNIPGFYAAGDISTIFSHQVVSAVHEGAQAALTANYFLFPPELK